MSGNKSNIPEHLFHYTTVQGATGIRQSGMIKPSNSNGGDAVYGNGVYMTSMTPNNSACAVLENNYAGYYKGDNRTEAHVRVATSDLDKTKLHKAPGARDIWVYNGEVSTRGYVPYNSNNVYK